VIPSKPAKKREQEFQLPRRALAASMRTVPVSLVSTQASSINYKSITSKERNQTLIKSQKASEYLPKTHVFGIAPSR